MNPESDEQLLARYAEAGSEAAFRSLVDRYAGMVLASALRRTGDRELAEDVSQRVFAILARKAKPLRRHPVLRAWLHTTTRLQCQSLLRAERRHRRKRKALVDEMLEPTETMPTEPPFDEREPVIDEALDELGESDRRLILLRFADGASYVEIGKRIGRSETACRKRVSRALEKLRLLLRDKGVAVPAVTIGSLVMAQLGKASQAGSGKLIAAGALSNLATLSPTTLITNTLETMAYGKTKAFVAAAALAAIPLAMQWRENSSLRAELAELKSPEAPASSIEPSLAHASSAIGARIQHSRSGEAEDEAVRLVKVKRDVIDAILANRVREPLSRRRLSRMGVEGDDLEAVEAIRERGINALRLIEKEHAESVSDEQGDYIAIGAFPVERREWLEGMEAELRTLLGDDRAAVIASMIAFSDNDEDVGLHRRELFIIDHEDGRARIEERSFNHAGQHTDSDFDLVGAETRTRWGHLLDLGGEGWDNVKKIHEE